MNRTNNNSIELQELEPKNLDKDDILTWNEYQTIQGTFIPSSLVEGETYNSYSLEAIRHLNQRMNNSIVMIGGFKGIWDEETQTGHLSNISLQTLKQAIAYLITHWYNFLIAPTDRQPYELQQNIGPETKVIGQLSIEDLDEYEQRTLKGLMKQSGIEQYVRSRGTIIPKSALNNFIKAGDLTTDSIITTAPPVESMSGTAGYQNLVNQEFKNQIERLGGNSTAVLPVSNPATESISGLAQYQQGVNIENRGKEQQQDIRLTNLEAFAGLEPLQLQVGKNDDQIITGTIGEVFFNGTARKDPSEGWNTTETATTVAKSSVYMRGIGSNGVRLFTIDKPGVDYSNGHYLVELSPSTTLEIARWNLTLAAFPAGYLTDVCLSSTTIYMSDSQNNTAWSFPIANLPAPGTAITPTNHSIIPNGLTGIEHAPSPNYVLGMNGDEIWVFDPSTLTPISIFNTGLSITRGIGLIKATGNTFLSDLANPKKIYEVELNFDTFTLTLKKTYDPTINDYLTLGGGLTTLYGENNTDFISIGLTGRYTFNDNWDEDEEVNLIITLKQQSNLNNVAYTYEIYKNSILPENLIDSYSGNIDWAYEPIDVEIETRTLFFRISPEVGEDYDLTVGDTLIITSRITAGGGEITIIGEIPNYYQINVLTETIAVTTDTCVDLSEYDQPNQTAVNNLIKGDIEAINSTRIYSFQTNAEADAFLIANPDVIVASNEGE